MATYNFKVDQAKKAEQLNTERMRAAREELAERIAWAVPQDGIYEPLKGVRLFRVSSCAGPTHGVTLPALSIIVQGTKEIYVGEACYRYDPHHYLIATAGLPAIIHYVEASQEKPFLNFLLTLEPTLVASVMLEASMFTARNEKGSVRAVDVSPLDADLLDAALRLVRLLNATPEEVQVLQPLITREIILRLIVGKQRERLCQLTEQGGHSERIAHAIKRLRQGFDQPLRIDSLARDLGMSQSGFNSHFKAVTAMSPLQFQKQLRLQEARRLMLGENLDAASTAHRVGYEDTSQFSREYKRHFGQPPRRDVQRLRKTDAAVGVGVQPKAGSIS